MTGWLPWGAKPESEPAGCVLWCCCWEDLSRATCCLHALHVLSTCSPPALQVLSACCPHTIHITSACFPQSHLSGRAAAMLEHDLNRHKPAATGSAICCAKASRLHSRSLLLHSFLLVGCGGDAAALAAPTVAAHTATARGRQLCSCLYLGGARLALGDLNGSADACMHAHAPHAECP